MFGFLKRKPAVKVGQVWKYTPRNPFTDDSYMLVREIKGGYVRFIDPKFENNPDPDFYSASESVDIFLYGSELVKDS